MPEAAPMAEPRRPGPVLGESLEFSGLVVLHGTARIEGRVHGDVLGADRLRIGERALVEGRVEAGEVVVAGELVGELYADRRVELCATARVRAAIHAPRLVLAEGSFLDGPCRTGAAAANRQAPAPQGRGAAAQRGEAERRQAPAGTAPAP